MRSTHRAFVATSIAHEHRAFSAFSSTIDARQNVQTFEGPSGRIARSYGPSSALLEGVQRCVEWPVRRGQRPTRIIQAQNANLRARAQRG